jgi:hypothetical protein
MKQQAGFVDHRFQSRGLGSSVSPGHRWSHLRFLGKMTTYLSYTTDPLPGFTGVRSE